MRGGMVGQVGMRCANMFDVFVVEAYRQFNLAKHSTDRNRMVSWSQASPSQFSRQICFVSAGGGGGVQGNEAPRLRQQAREKTAMLICPRLRSFGVAQLYLPVTRNR